MFDPFFISLCHESWTRQGHAPNMASLMCANPVISGSYPAVPLHQVNAQQAKQHLVGRPGELGVVLEAVALEVLHKVAVLHQLLRDRITEDGQAAVRLPVLQESPTQ